jgi:hypothetical protein
MLLWQLLAALSSMPAPRQHHHLQLRVCASMSLCTCTVVASSLHGSSKACCQIYGLMMATHAAAVSFGFAIPSDTVRRVVNQLIKCGRVMHLGLCVYLAWAGTCCMASTPRTCWGVPLDWWCGTYQPRVVHTWQGYRG